MQKSSLINEKKNKVLFDFLNRHQIRFRTIQHEPVFTVEQAKKCINLPNTVGTKNLFLRNKKKDKFYLFVLAENFDINFSSLSESISESRLSFASNDDLEKQLRCSPGAVSLLSLYHESARSVIAVFQDSILSSEQIQQHPWENFTTMLISGENLFQFVTLFGNPILVLRSK